MSIAEEKKQQQEKKDKVLLAVSNAKQQLWNHTADTGKDEDVGLFRFQIEGTRFEVFKRFLALELFDRNVRAYFRGMKDDMSKEVYKDCIRKAMRAQRTARQTWANKPQKRSLVI